MTPSERNAKRRNRENEYRRRRRREDATYRERENARSRTKYARLSSEQKSRQYRKEKADGSYITKSAAYRKRRTAKDPRWQKRKHLKPYGLTLEVFDALKDFQGNACVICLRTFSAELLPHVDHDHATGKVRGLLCSRCNVVLGLMEDSPSLLTACVQYLLNGDSFAAFVTKNGADT